LYKIDNIGVFFNLIAFEGLKMCGINGFFNYSRVNLSNGEVLINQMNKAIAHRGPDDTGIWTNRNHEAYFGHQRLSILDLSSRGHQPMISPKGTVIVYNGEVYNYKSLKDNFADRSFFSETDTEVILYAYESHGQSCLDELNGMFAFAIWDEDKKEIFLARDRIGIKPLYYTTMNGIFAFSSEIKALLTLPWIKVELDEEALYHFLTFNKTLPPQTMFKHIHKFHPGYKMVVGKKGIKLYEPYWEVSYTNYDSLTSQEIKDLIYSEFTRSVEARMVSDVPIGAFLSGGVDSSAVVSIMNQSSNNQVKTYSIGFDNAPEYNELDYAKQISKRLGTEHIEKIVRPQEIEDFLPKITEIYDEPLADATSIPIYFISELARKNGTTVILTGDGGDELFFGYTNWMRYIKFNRFYNFFMQLPKSFKKSILHTYGLLDNSSPIYEIISRATKKQELFWGGAGGIKESRKHSILSREYIKRLHDLDSYDQIAYYSKLYEAISHNGRDRKYLDWLCFFGLKAIIPNYYLFRADRLGMSNSIEIRVPFLDHSFVNLALSIPSRLKVKGGEPKYILKNTLERILPKEILYRKKQGFCVPLLEWSGDIIVDYLERNIESFCHETGLFNQEGLREQIKQTKIGNKNYVFSLWNIYFLISWFRKWLL